MTRDELLADLVRVAAEVGVAVHHLPRSIYREKGLYGDAYKRFDGSWHRLRQSASVAIGDRPHDQDIVEREVSLANHSYVRKLERQIGRPEAMARLLRQSLTQALQENPVVIYHQKRWWKRKAHKPIKRMLSVLLSDLHFGVIVDPKEIYGGGYTWEIARRRLAQVLVQAAEWKPEHRSETALTLVLNGDIIEGVIHIHDQNVMPLKKQMTGALYLLAGAIDFLLCHFPRIHVVCTPGNHGRVVHRGDGRTTAQRDDSFENAIYDSLEMVFRGRPEVTFHIPESGIGHYFAPGGHLIVTSHGDTEPTVGNVGKSMNTERLANKLRTMDSARVFKKSIDILAVGHWHTPLVLMLAHGAHTIVNGCLIGGSPFSQNGVGAWVAEPAQVLFESVEHYPLGDTRIVRVRSADTDRSLDKVIAPIGYER